MLLVAGCGLVDQGEDDEVDPDAAALLERVAEASEPGPFRFELTLGVGRDGGSADEPVAAGVSDGEQLRVEIDGTALPADLVTGLVPERFDLPDLGNVDRGLEAVVDGDDVYLRSPSFAVLDSRRVASTLPDDVQDVAAELGNGWARVDRRAFAAVLPGPLQNLDPARGLDGETVSALMEAAGGVDDLGPSEVDGEELHGVTAEVSLAEVGELLHLDVGELPGVGDLLEGPAGSLELPVELWIDERHHIRRLRVARRFPGDTHLAVGLELDDHGDDDIEVDTPDEAVDVSSDVAQTLVLLALGG